MLLTAFLVAIVNIYNKDMFKVFITIPFFSYSMKKIFNLEINKSLLYMIIATFYMFIGEIIVGIIFGITGLEYTYLSQNIFGTTLGAMAVILATIPLLSIKRLKNKMISLSKTFNNKRLIYIVVLLVLGIAIFAYKNTTGIENIMMSIMNVLLFATFVVILYSLYKESQKSEEISDNYNVLLTYLEKYEIEIVEKSKIIHEHNNQMIVINGYIGDEKKLKEYVGEIMEEQKKIKENPTLKNIDKLPKGLKSLIYYKFSHTNEEVIATMDVEGNMEKFNELPAKKNKDVLKVVGILIDNAIEAVEKEEEKYIDISFEIEEDKFIMEMYNTWNEEIDEKEIMEEGYSTKGKGRGYGLSLVKDIIKSDKSYSLEIDIKDGQFRTMLVVKI